MNMNIKRLACLVGLILMLGSLAGCPQPCPETFVSHEQLVADYNANAARVPQLWARAQITVKMPDSLPVHLDGVMLLSKGGSPGEPVDFVLQGRRASVPVFGLGSAADAGIYYFWWRYGEKAQAMWGRSEYAGAPGLKAMPIDPNDLLSVLSVCELPADFTDLPTVALWMDTTPGKCAYVLSYMDRQPISGKLLLKRQVYFNWSDRDPPRPFAVKFFDPTGLPVLTAKLADYRPIQTGHPGDADPPVMPTNIRIDWPRRRSSLQLKLSEMTAEPVGNPARAAKFDPPVTPDRIIQIDRHLGQGDLSP